MIFAEVIYWFIGISCGLMMVASLRNAGLKSLWFWESLGLLGLCVFSGLTSELRALTIGVWITLFLIPILGFSVLQKQVARGNYRVSRQLAKILSNFHPGDGWTDYPDILQALMLVQAGQQDLALTILRRFERSSAPMAIHAMITMFRIERRWKDCINWIESLPSNRQASPALLTAYARSLGEIQDYPRFFHLIESNWHKLQARSKPYNQLILMALAFGGQWKSLQRFFSEPRHHYPSETQMYWLATAAMTAGRLDLAQAQFQQLLHRTQDKALKQSVEARLRSPLAPSGKYISERLYQNFQMFDQVHSPAVSRYDFGQQNSGLFWVTWSLLIANVLMFFLEVQQGGSEQGAVLYSLGGLWPPDVWKGQYWRLISANFLHSGSVHLTMNMMGLLVLGPFVERILGWFKFFVIYSLSGLGAATCIAYAPLWFGAEPEFTVGASGAIMGLVGAIAAITLWGWVVDQASIAAKRFRTILIMIGIQMAFDFSTPQISITGHLSGMVVGFFVTLGVIALFGFKEPSTRSLRSLG